jgi:aspartate aminotransferase
MTARAAALKEQGGEIIMLSQGEPDFDTPANIREAGVKAICDGKTRYTAVAGIAPLREAIRSKLPRDNALDYSIDQITVGCGVKQVVFNGLYVSLNPGDEVVIPGPCWVSYPDIVRLAGGTPVLVECSENADFKLSPEALDAVITPRTKWLMLNSPFNPTDSVYSASDRTAVRRRFGDIHTSGFWRTISTASSSIRRPSLRRWPLSRRTSMNARSP